MESLQTYFVDDKQMTRLSCLHDSVYNLVKDKRCLYVDVPVYFNIGDHLISGGTFDFFKRKAVRLEEVVPITCFDRACVEDIDVVVFQGGGNFGDIWPDIHERRMQIVEHLLAAGKEVVILPQSICYQSSQLRDRDARIIKFNKNFHLFTRDQNSFQIASEISSNAYLAPDMAHQLYDRLLDVRKSVHIANDNIALFRKDKEAISARKGYISTLDCLDWDDIVSQTPYYRTMKRYIKLYRWIHCKIGVSGYEREMSGWKSTSWKIILHAAKCFAKANVVITDRLHGVILSALVGRKFKAVDNNYGKLSGYIDKWFCNNQKDGI